MLALWLAQQLPPAGLGWAELGPLGLAVGGLFAVLLKAWARDIARADRNEAEVKALNREIRELLAAVARVETAATAVRGRS